MAAERASDEGGVCVETAPLHRSGNAAAREAMSKNATARARNAEQGGERRRRGRDLWRREQDGSSRVVEQRKRCVFEL